MDLAGSACHDNMSRRCEILISTFIFRQERGNEIKCLRSDAFDRTLCTVISFLLAFRPRRCKWLPKAADQQRFLCIFAVYYQFQTHAPLLNHRLDCIPRDYGQQ
ncbi:hypothetical protein EAG_05409 [Camponotus floridanus]|uniref:Uncharacterized protein n=1 Tax=Camponotus floridanus TaxID=104421 RepID=E2A5Z1_CAMFO|nr:hypothetical protein EAG_05409 [Camponotus floridanus]